MDGINIFLSILHSFQKGRAELADPSGDERRLCLPVNLSLLQKMWVTESKESKRHNKEAVQSSILP